jgi:tetratricopeptide (TPR) repeat protein
MVDYFKILDVPITSQEEEIKVAIKDKRRLWMQKTNSPQLERRQEAEVKVQQIDEAEKILLDSLKRSEYEKQLRTTATKDERTLDETELKGGENLVKQGWDLLIKDKIADAIYVATKATEKQGDNPEAWALLAQAKHHWGEIEDSIYEYKKAIKLKPNDPDYYFELGGVYESEQRWKDAVDSYQKASKINPSVSVYRAAIGQVFLRLEMYTDAIPILETCVNEEPENTTYNWFLALAYNDLVLKKYMIESNDGSYYLVSKEASEFALKYFTKALDLRFEDDELKAIIRKNLDIVNWSLSKHWGRSIGSTVKWVLILGIVGIGLFVSDEPALILMALAVWALWIFFGFKEGYKINKKVLSNN